MFPNPNVDLNIYEEQLKSEMPKDSGAMIANTYPRYIYKIGTTVADAIELRLKEIEEKQQELERKRIELQLLQVKVCNASVKEVYVSDLLALLKHL